MEGSSRSGYEHRYRVSMGDERGFPKLPYRTYFLEVRTKFILKPVTPTGAGEILIDTERFGYRMSLAELYTPETVGPVLFKILSGRNTVDMHIRSRLSKYCMPDAQIRDLAQTAFDFVHDPQYESFHTVPVLLAIDVYTVQLEGEPLDVTVDRSLKPDFLIPLQLRWRENAPLMGARADLLSYLNDLPVVRVREDVDDVRAREDVDMSFALSVWMRQTLLRPTLTHGPYLINMIFMKNTVWGEMRGWVSWRCALFVCESPLLGLR